MQIYIRRVFSNFRASKMSNDDDHDLVYLLHLPHMIISSQFSFATIDDLEAQLQCHKNNNNLDLNM